MSRITAAIAAIAGCLQPGDRTLAVFGQPVLARLRLANQADDGDLDADNVGQLSCEICLRGIGHLPAGVATPLHGPGQQAGLTPKPFHIVVDEQRAGDVGDRIGPRRHHLVRDLLRLVPVRGDVGIGRLEDHQHIVTGGVSVPKRIRPRDMPQEPGRAIAARVEDERNVIRHQFPAIEGDKRAER